LSGGDHKENVIKFFTENGGSYNLDNYLIKKILIKKLISKSNKTHTKIEEGSTPMPKQNINNIYKL